MMMMRVMRMSQAYNTVNYNTEIAPYRMSIMMVLGLSMMMVAR